MEERQFGTYRIGPIRPPSEARSLLLQVTAGCTWNKCKFCELYKNSSFRAYTVDSIKEDIDTMAKYRDLLLELQEEDGTWNRKRLKQFTEAMTYEEYHCFMMMANWLATGGKNVFIQDGNTIALKAERLGEVLQYLKKTFPHIRRITSYGRAETLSKVSGEQYKALKDAGLDRIHSGFESGSDKVLELINKGTTSEQEILAGKNIKAGGIELSVYFMPGIGGKDLTEENALETARVVREIDPDYVRIRTAVIKRGTGLWEDYQKGIFQLCSENEKIEEIKLLIENTGNCSGRVVSDHMINLLQNVEGQMKEDREVMLNILDEYLSLPEETQRQFQFARRKLMISSPGQLKEIASDQILQIDKACKAITSEQSWTERMNEVLMEYI